MKKYSWQWYLKNDVDGKQKAYDRHLGLYNFFNEHKIFGLLKQAFPEGSWSYSYDYCFTLPMRFALIDEVKVFMEEQFANIRLKGDRQYVWDDSAGRFLEYDYLDKEIEITFRTTVKGSTCILNKIGEENKVVPIYEVVCSEEAATEFALNKDVVFIQ